MTTASMPYEVPPIKSTARRVFAHYLPPYPISIDNRPSKVDFYTRNYLNPAGENGKYRSVGGLLRDRPIGRAPLKGDYRMKDAVTEVNQASTAGIDGFTVNIMSWSGVNWTRTLRLAKAARASGTGFVIVPNIDLASGAKRASVALMAKKLAELYEQPGTYRLADGRYVLSSFKAEVNSATWWQSLITELDRKHHIKVAFVGVFLNLTQARINQYAPISYALGIWGMRTAKAVRQPGLNLAGRVRKAGRKWIAPVAPQDVRHRSRIYAEAQNTSLLRASWARAIKDKADLVQVISWNDYSESTAMAPSVAHGRAFLDLSSYYLTKLKTGKAPVIRAEELIVTHRIQRYGTKPTSQGGEMNWRLTGTAVRPRNTAEVVSILKSAATVTFKVGRRSVKYAAPAGISTKVVPLQLGSVSASAARGGKVFATVTSKHKVRSSVKVWDLQYYAATSRD